MATRDELLQRFTHPEIKETGTRVFHVLEGDGEHDKAGDAAAKQSAELARGEIGGGPNAHRGRRRRASAARRSLI